MKNFQQWVEDNHNEDWRNWAAGAAATMAGFSGGQPQARAADPPAITRQMQQEVSLSDNDPRKPTASVQGGQITIKYLASTAFGASWKTGKNREVNEQLLTKYSTLASQKLGVRIGEKIDVQENGKFLVWTLKIN